MEQLGPGCKNSDDALYARDVVNYPGVLKWMNFSLVAKNLVKEAVAPRAKQSWLLLWIIHSSSILLATTA